jgi:phage gp46-like protein
MVDVCAAVARSTRCVFWVTQVCESINDPCGGECADLGLQLLCPIDGNCELPDRPRTINNDNWLRGLIYNILYTDGRNPDPSCVRFSGNSGGHWSDAFQKKSSGSTYVHQKSYGSVSEARADAAFRLKNDLGKLIDYGVAKTVDVTVEYTGQNKFQANIVVGTTDGTSLEVGLSGQRLNGIIAF